MAEKHAPPARASSGEMIGICLVIGIIGFFFHAVILPVMLLVCVALFQKSHNYNKYVYPRLYHDWDNSYLCQRCANVCDPFNEPPLPPYSGQPQSFLIIYIIVLLAIPCALVYEYMKPVNQEHPAAVDATTASPTSTPMTSAVLSADTKEPVAADDPLARLANQHAEASPTIDPTPVAQPATTSDEIKNAANAAADQPPLTATPHLTASPEVINPLNDNRPIHREEN